MEIIHVSAECYPVAKAGGLGDVVGALPKYQNELGHIAKVVMPMYRTKFLYENNLNEIYANISVVSRILLTLPITVACAERSFSKLKIIQNYLRSSMSQDRLDNLTAISIESDIVNDLNIEDLRLQFSWMKARKAIFSK